MITTRAPDGANNLWKEANVICFWWSEKMRSKKRLLFQSLVCIASAFLARGCAVTSIMEHVASVSVPHNPSQEWRETQFLSDCPRLGNNFSFHLFDFEHQAWFCDMKTDILIGSKTYPVDMIGTGEILYLGVSIYLRDLIFFQQSGFWMHDFSGMPHFLRQIK